MEPEIIGSGQLDYAYGMEKEYLKNYLGEVNKTIATIRTLIDEDVEVGQASMAHQLHVEHLERVLENNYVIKDGLEMSLQDIAWQEANL